ncbi:cellulase family glycosylhydrolase [Microlunatus sp. GCM10028923]|uniref:cellulase family glycosylhydrolase n=1 Tax=Microlunatus sp. GCM10028923 TaxID=3273400 RepID=UPI00360896E8
MMMTSPASPRRRWRTALASATAVAVGLGVAVVGHAPAVADAGGELAAVAAAASADSLAASRNTAFVERDGSRLTLNGRTFRASGMNLYWLGLDENVDVDGDDKADVAYPTYFRIKDALDTAGDLGVNVIRSHMAISTSQDGQQPLVLMPEIGEYNMEAFATIDYALAYAGSQGIRFVLSLTDQWDYFHGGGRDFIAPYGLSGPWARDGQITAFYEEERAITAFQDYVDTVMNRVNPLTGIRYGDDPTIMAWELGNELNGVPQDWVDRMAEFIKQRGPKQLVAAGQQNGISDSALASPGVDLVDAHYYRTDFNRWIPEDARRVAEAGKAYIAGEIGWTDANVSVLQDATKNPDVAGVFPWSLFGNNDRGGMVPHDDGFTLHYPGTNEKMRTWIAGIREFSESIGLSVDKEMDPPLIVGIDSLGGRNQISWRGTAGAVSYRVERSTDGSTWSLLLDGAVGTNGSPVSDSAPVRGARYRVVAISAEGTEKSSEVVTAGPGERVLVDPLADFTQTSADEDAALVAPSGAVAGSERAMVEWSFPGTTRASFSLSRDAQARVEVHDGLGWRSVPIKTTRTSNGTSLEVAGFVAEKIRVVWTEGALHRAMLAVEPDLFDPAEDFSLMSAKSGDLKIDGTNRAYLDGDSARLARNSITGAESATWKLPDVNRVEFVAYSWPHQESMPLELSASSDGQNFWELSPPQVATTKESGDGWAREVYTVRSLSDAAYIRVAWPEGKWGRDGQTWTPQIAEVRLFAAK